MADNQNSLTIKPIWRCYKKRRLAKRQQVVTNNVDDTTTAVPSRSTIDDQRESRSQIVGLDNGSGNPPLDMPAVPNAQHALLGSPNIQHDISLLPRRPAVEKTENNTINTAVPSTIFDQPESCPERVDLGNGANPPHDISAFPRTQYVPVDSQQIVPKLPQRPPPVQQKLEDEGIGRHGLSLDDDLVRVSSID
ncbi:hypothetical protein P167DRAFT_550295 [Morchella conica CCBAS932]|uniref:Uncharacterized protein n=1 Tax=Morchella conica CCBAS932 TaxID=1392247 RepID=A0A3N4KEG5_9PEZI|nr:hypothetical protein P167DRAFT_550295 [Morchella conica CCBAS932]